MEPINPNGYNNPYEFRYKVKMPSIHSEANYNKLQSKLPTTNFKNLSSRIVSNPDLTKDKTILEKLSPYASQARSAIGLATNLSSVNKMDTNIESRLITNSPFTYTNRSNYLRNRNNASFRNLLNNRTGVPINTTQAYAATLKADGEVALGEAERQDAAIRDFNNRNLQINASNLETINRNNYINNTLKNNKEAQKASAYSSYLENLDTLELQKNAQARDLKAVEILSRAGESGRASGLFDELLKKYFKDLKG